MEVRRIPNWNPDEELYHHGIKGQRWGVRRYQNPDGSLTPAGVRRYGTVENFNRSITKKGVIQYTKDKRKMKKLRQIREQKKAWEAEKERIVNSGDKKALREIQHELTDEQISRAINRIAFNEVVNGTNKSRLDKAAEFIDKYADTAANLAKYANTASSIAKAIGDVRTVANGGTVKKEGGDNSNSGGGKKKNKGGGNNSNNNNSNNGNNQAPSINTNSQAIKEVITDIDPHGYKTKKIIKRKF